MRWVDFYCFPASQSSAHSAFEHHRLRLHSKFDNAYKLDAWYQQWIDSKALIIPECVWGTLSISVEVSSFMDKEILLVLLDTKFLV